MPPADPQEPRRPDYRFTLANERTFLAWARTCLALLAGAVALVQLAPDLASQTFREVTAVVLAVLAAGAAVGGLARWLRVEAAMGRDEPLPRGVLPAVVAVGLALVALAVVVALLVELVR